MKDALGHGSNGRGAYLRPDGYSAIPSRPFHHSGGDPDAHRPSDHDAAEALKNAKTPATEVHPAFGKRTTAPAAEQKYPPGQHPVEKYRGNPL